MSTINQRKTAERNWALYVVKGMQSTLASTVSKHSNVQGALKALAQLERALRKVRYVG